MDALGGGSYVAAVQQTSSPAAAVTAAHDSIADPDVFFYGAVLEALQAHARPPGSSPLPSEYAATADLLKLLAFGNVRDVDATSDGVKALLAKFPAVLGKLRLLSFLTLCSQRTLRPSGVCMTYSDVEAALGLTGAVAVQAAVLSAVQHHLCTARLNEEARQLRVYTFESRNVTSADVALLKQRLAQWTAYAETHLREIEGL